VETGIVDQQQVKGKLNQANGKIQRWLTHPAASIQHPEERQKAQVLAQSLIIVTSLYLIPEIFRIVSSDSGPSAFLYGFIPLVFAYIFSRTHYFRIGTFIATAFFTLLPLSSLLLGIVQPAETITAVIWIIPTLIFGSLLLSRRQTVTLAIVNVFAVLASPFLVPGVTFASLAYPLGFVLVVIIMLNVVVYIRQAYLEQIKAQADELARSEAQFRALVEHSQAGVLQIGPDFCFVYVNDELCRIVGYPSEELIGHDFRKVLDEESQNMVADSYQRRQSGEDVPSRYEFGIIRKDGEKRRIEISAAVFMDENGRTQTIAQLLDITERKEMENALRDSEALYQSLVNSLPQNIFRRDVNGRFTFANEYFCRLHGMPLDEIIGKTDFDLHPSEMASKYWADDQRVMKTGQPYEAVEVHQRNNSSIRYAQVIKTPTYDAAGRLIGIQGIFWDITEVKQAQEALQKAHNELEERVEERTQELAAANARLKELDYLKNKFIEDMSHELRTPLANMNLYLDLLEMGKPEKRESYMAVMRQAIGRVTRISEDVLAMIRLELFKDEIQFKPVNLNKLAADVIRQQKKLVDAAGLDLIFASHPTNPLIRCDTNQIQHCLINLIANSINYTPEGQIEVCIKLDEVSRRVCLAVSDTGTGVDLEDLPYLFDRFYRGRKIGQSNIPGSGLGLALVKEIAELHGGSVEAENRLDKGSIFRLWLPLAEMGNVL
jgi:PAS domain S-box-containing protein